MRELERLLRSYGPTARLETGTAGHKWWACIRVGERRYRMSTAGSMLGAIVGVQRPLEPGEVLVEFEHGYTKEAPVCVA